LVKNPVERDSASKLLEHGWVRRMEREICLLRLKEEAWEPVFINYLNNFTKLVDSFYEAQKLFTTMYKSGGSH